MLEYITLPAVAFPLFYAPWAWHGGQSLNMRYLIPVIPFACVLVVASLKAVLDVRPVLDKAGKDLLLRVALGTLAFYLLLFGLDPGYRETTYLTVPLLLAVVISLAAILFRLRPIEWVGRAFLAAVAAGIIWGGAVAFSYDVPRSLAMKTLNEEVAESVAAVIEDSSFLFAEWSDDLYGVRWLRDDVLVALPHQDDFADSARLIRLSLNQGRSVYGALTAESWRRLPDAGGSWREITAVGRYVVKRYEA